jgi:Glycosyltransferase family 87
MTLELTRPQHGGGQARPAVTAPLALLRREWAAALFTACALFAGAVALISANPPQRLWGMLAAGGYGVAAITAAITSDYPGRRLARGRPWPWLARPWLARPRRAPTPTRLRGTELAVLVSIVGALIAPLTWMAVAGLGQPEIAVITRSAALLLSRGAPYPGAAVIAAAHGPYAYSPYLPALLVFGVPHALFGGGLLTDPRLWFAAVFVITFGGGLSVARVPHAWRWTALITASPLVAYPLSTGGDDLPVLALICLGLALLGRRPNPVAAGLVLGLAAAMKATAWPALAVALALVAARNGRRGAAWFAVSVLAVAGAADGPVMARQPGAMMANTVLFPLGLTRIKSPAESVLPGHLIAQAWGGGHWVAIALVVISGLAVAGSLIAWPPQDEQAAGWRLVVGLALMFTFAPATRFGYFIYPLGLAAWLLLPRSLVLTAPDPLRARRGRGWGLGVGSGDRERSAWRRDCSGVGS